MSIVLVGLDHHTASVEIRELLALSSHDTQSFLVGAYHDLPVTEICVLSTCNRLEIYAVTDDENESITAIKAFLGNQFEGFTSDQSITDFFYVYKDDSAIEHLFCVACGLESMIIGEPQILGQVNEAFRTAQQHGTLGATLSQLMMKAVQTGKRSRTETDISRHTTSVSHAAALLAQDSIPNFQNCRVLVAGAGEMALQAVKAVHARGVLNLTIINRTYQRGKELAEHFGCVATDWTNLPDALVRHDVVISATGAPHIVLDYNTVQQALKRRNDRPLLIIDIAVPRDVEATIGDLAGVQLYDIDDLQDTVDENIAQRQASIVEVKAIIDEELAHYLEWLDGRQVVPVITDLRRKAEAIAQTELEQALRRLDGIDSNGQKVVQRMAHRIVNKLLYAPTAQLKSHAVNGNGDAYAHVVRDLFHLDDENGHLPPSNRKGKND